MDPIKGHLNNSNQRYNQEKNAHLMWLKSPHAELLTAGENALAHLRDLIPEIEQGLSLCRQKTLGHLLLNATARWQIELIEIINAEKKRFTDKSKMFHLIAQSKSKPEIQQSEKRLPGLRKTEYGHFF